uniref:Putative DNA-binding protein REB1 n=1 Tax=Davidia involucrata TaxID=16924 RepID=A0A5B7BNV8_DAVIN
MGIRVEEEEVLLEKVRNKSKKNKKIEANALLEVGDCTDTVPNRVEDGFNLSKEDKKKKKDRKKHEVYSDVQLGGIRNEAVNKNDHAEVDNAFQKEDDQKKKKKKKRKLEAAEDEDTSNNEAHVGGEEERSLQMNDVKDSGYESGLKARKDKTKKHKENRKKDGSDKVLSTIEIVEDKKIRKDKGKRQKRSKEQDIVEMKNEEEGAKKKNKTVRWDKEDGDVKGHRKVAGGNEIGKARENYDGNIVEKIEKKKRKSKKKKSNDNLGAGLQETMGEKMGNESTIIEDKDSSRNKTMDRETKNGNKGKKKSKKVRFSGHVEVFPSSDDPSTGKEKNQENDLVRGKRFSREEDEMIKEAVFNYIKEHDLGEEGVNMILHCKSHPEIKGCWKDIGAVLPYRPQESIYYRAHILFERDERRAWTSDEYELVRKFHEKHGPDWRKLGDALGKHRFHVKDTWRRIKLPNMKKGRWSQEEYQTLFDLVNLDLRIKAFEEKKSKHGMLRDNICWGAISDRLSTRTNANCCLKWYQQLTSPMVAEGEWADADDYRLLISLFSLDACCIEDVDWDYLLDHRCGDVCRKRWNQMVHHLGNHANMSFAEQVDTLSKRYCPDILEAREIWDSKPVVS